MNTTPAGNYQNDLYTS